MHTGGTDEGKKKRGRQLSDDGVRAKLYREVCDAHLARIVKVDLKSELFTYDIDERAMKHAKMSPEHALDKLLRIQHQVVKVNDRAPIAALSSINQEHTEILQTLTIKKPTLPVQLTLL